MGSYMGRVSNEKNDGLILYTGWGAYIQRFSFIKIIKKHHKTFLREYIVVQILFTTRIR